MEGFTSIFIITQYELNFALLISNNRGGPDIEATTQSSSLPLPYRVPGKNYSFSDHEAVDACLKLRRINMQDNDMGYKMSHQTNREYKRARSMETRSECVNSVTEAIEVNSMRYSVNMSESHKRYNPYCASKFARH